MAIIIFGASGFLGGELMAYYAQKDIRTTGTYAHNKKEGLIKCDLGKPDLTGLSIDFGGVNCAIICSAITNMDMCRTDWAGTYEVNVSGVKRLIARLYNLKIKPVFISTDYVFDGHTGNYSEDDERNPVLAYGRQKKEVEDYLMHCGGNYIIARLARMYCLSEDRNTLLHSIARGLRMGQTLALATDQVFSPTFVGDVCRALDILIEQKFKGGIHICAGEAIARYALARLIKSKLKIKTGKLAPCCLEDLKFGDHRPLNTSMNNQKCVNLTNMRFTTLGEAIEQLRYSGNIGVRS